jgi:hypothetical protein
MLAEEENNKEVINILNDAEKYYKGVIKLLNKNKLPFLVGGTFAVRIYTGIERETKDIDFFCKAGDYPKILTFLKEAGYKILIEDERWIAKASKGKFFVDFIWGSANAIAPVDDSWFVDAPSAKLYGEKIKLLPVQYLIWAKVFVQDRYKYDGADVAHLILKQNQVIDWKKLLDQMEMYWEVLFQHVINFRFVYPSERKAIPKWLVEELVQRVSRQLTMPYPEKKICRGRLFSRSDYLIDIQKWGYADLIGESGA